MAQYLAFATDVDIAIGTALGNYTINNELNQPVIVPVVYTTPETEIVVETHPSIVFYQADVKPDPTRVTNNLIADDIVKNAQGNITQLTLRPDADPYVLLYDIRIYTLYQQDSKQLEKNIMTTFPMRGTLSVNGNLLDMFFYDRKDLSKGPQTLNSSSMKILEKTDQREQVISLKYKVYTSFDVGTKTTLYTAQTVTTTTTTK